MAKDSLHESFVPVLHGWRGVAALAVLIFHWSQLFPDMSTYLSDVQFLGTTWNMNMQISFGWLGVPLFFVLSGYLLGGKLERVDMGLSELFVFFRNRLSRIYPAVWVQMFILVLVGFWVDGLIYDLNLYQFLMNFFLLINLPPDFVRPINGVWWTLPVEISFYFLLPLIVLLRKRYGMIVVLASALAVTLAWRFYVMHKYQGENYLNHLPLLDSLPGALFSFVAGYFVSSVRFQFGPSQRRLLLYCLFALLYVMESWLISVGSGYWSGSWLLLFWNSCVAFLIAMVLCLSLQPPRELQWLRSRVAVYFGDISFGIYLWHLPVSLVMLNLWPGMWEGLQGSMLALLVVFIVTVLLASLSFYFIEKPFILFSRKFSFKIEWVR